MITISILCALIIYLFRSDLGSPEEPGIGSKMSRTAEKRRSL
jgi:hypothetical protein